MDWRKPFRPFLDMTYLGVPELDLTGDGSDFDGMVPPRGQGRLLLGTYGEDEVRDKLGEYGIRDQLRRLGFADVRVCVDASDRDHQQVKVFPVLAPLNHPEDVCEAAQQEPIADIILREALLSPKEDLYPNPPTLSFLVIQWIRLQNPTVEAKPCTLLPGQDYPGLGAGMLVMDMLMALAQIRRLHGIVNRPEFIHNALLYSRYFQFLNPEVEGRLRAMKRDLSHLTLRQVAWAVEKGWVLEDNERTFFRWYQSEQIYPGCKELTRYLDQKRYKKTLEKTLKSTRYSLKPGVEKELERYGDCD